MKRVKEEKVRVKAKEKNIKDSVLVQKQASELESAQECYSRLELVHGCA